MVSQKKADKMEDENEDGWVDKRRRGEKEIAEVSLARAD